MFKRKIDEKENAVRMLKKRKLVGVEMSLKKALKSENGLLIEWLKFVYCI